MTEYYKLKFPLQRVINFMPGDIVIDVPGNIYQVDGRDKPIKIVQSVLLREYSIKGLNDNEKKLFINISNHEINRFFDNP